MRVQPLTCAIGAEISGVDLSHASRDEGLFAEIKAALLQHKVLFFRDQGFSRAEHVAFARRFGELEDHPVAGSDPENPGLVRIYKSPDQPNDRYENSWHADGTWREAPSMGAVLRCIECPPVGGDTMWANMALAYEKLSQQVKDLIDPLNARHSIECTFGAAMPLEKRRALKAQYPDAEHPVVRIHPETGEKILFVCGFTTHFTNYHTPTNVRVGQDFTTGSSALLQYLISQAAIPEYQVRWRWKPNDVAVWDSSAWAWGDRPVKLIVPAPAGGSADIVARVFGQQLSADIGQPVVVENKPGGGAAIGLQAMLQAPPDGNTLAVVPSNVLTEIPHVMKVPYDPLKDILPVASLMRSGTVLVTPASTPAKDFPQLIEYLKKRKGAYSTYSPGTASHYAGLILSDKAKLDMQHIGYPGSAPALQALMGGQVDFMFDGMLTSVPLIKAGKLRAYAFTGKERSRHLPDVPTTAEVGFPDLMFMGCRAH